MIFYQIISFFSIFPYLLCFLHINECCISLDCKILHVYPHRVHMCGRKKIVIFGSHIWKPNYIFLVAFPFLSRPGMPECQKHSSHSFAPHCIFAIIFIRALGSKMGNCLSSALPRETRPPTQYKRNGHDAANLTVCPQKAQQYFQEMNRQNQTLLKSILKPSGTFEKRKSQKPVRFQLPGQVMNSAPAMAESVDPAVILKSVRRQQGLPAGQAPIRRVHLNLPPGVPRKVVLVAGIVLKRGKVLNFKSYDRANTIKNKKLGAHNQRVRMHFGDVEGPEELAFVAGIQIKSAPRLDMANSNQVTSIYVDEEDDGLPSGSGTPVFPTILGERPAKLKAIERLATMEKLDGELGGLLG